MGNGTGGEHRQVDPGDRGLVARLGPVELDVPRSLGYYGGLGLALAAGIIEPPLGLFIAAVPLAKMITRPGVLKPLRVVGELIDGMARPVGGDGDGYVRIVDAPPATPAHRQRPSRPSRPRRQT